MTTITMTPSEEIVTAAVTEATITDARGRVIKLKKPGILSQFRMVEALGDTAKNAVYMAMMMPLTFVTQIDDVAIYPAISKREYEALIENLGDEGVKAVMDGVEEYFGDKTEEQEKEQVKK